MKSILFSCSLAAILFSACKSTNQPKDLGFAKDWHIHTEVSKSFEMGTDDKTFHEGSRSGTIYSLSDTVTSFGFLYQYCSAEKFLGKRIRMSGFIKTENVKKQAGFLIRVEGDTAVLSFDNMMVNKVDRTIKGTTDWQRINLVVDVPVSSGKINFGAFLRGAGRIWFDDLSFEIVDSKTELTGFSQADTSKRTNPENLKGLMTEPSNLNFED